MTIVNTRSNPKRGSKLNIDTLRGKVGKSFSKEHAYIQWTILVNEKKYLITNNVPKHIGNSV